MQIYAEITIIKSLQLVWDLVGLEYWRMNPRDANAFCVAHRRIISGSSGLPTQWLMTALGIKATRQTYLPNPDVSEKKKTFRDWNFVTKTCTLSFLNNALS